MEILYLIIGIVLGIIVGWLLAKKQSAKLQEENGQLSGRLANAENVFREKKEEIDGLKADKDRLISENSRFKTESEHLRQKLQEQKEEIEQLQEKFTKDFQLIADKILKQNSSEFAESNQKRLDEILNPLKEKIQSFEQKVEEKHIKDLEGRTSLIEQIKSLKELNVQMSEETQNLTKALKGDNKAQGNWGELILEKVLERSGLVKGEEYQTQYSTTNEEGSRVQPDVIVNLPEDKHIVIDSKVSLVAYQNYVNAENDEQQEKYLRSHILSVKNHIKGLSEKDYASAYGINSPDFVLLFIPIESSFAIAMRADNELYQYAWDKKIVIVTPSTLLATLKTVKSVWNNEKQTRNAIEIARQAGALHDKFVGFIDDLDRIQKGIKTSQDAYDNAMKKLSTGKGNLVDATKRLEDLGAKTKKELPKDLLDE